MYKIHVRRLWELRRKAKQNACNMNSRRKSDSLVTERIETTRSCGFIHQQ